MCVMKCYWPSLAFGEIASGKVLVPIDGFIASGWTNEPQNIDPAKIGVYSGETRVLAATVISTDGYWMAEVGSLSALTGDLSFRVYQKNNSTPKHNDPILAYSIAKALQILYPRPHMPAPVKHLVSWGPLPAATANLYVDSTTAPGTARAATITTTATRWVAQWKDLNNWYAPGDKIKIVATEGAQERTVHDLTVTGPA